MPSDNAAAEWISRNSVVFTVFKNCPKLSQIFFLERKGGNSSLHIQEQNIRSILQTVDCGGEEVKEFTSQELQMLSPLLFIQRSQC